MLIKGVVQYPGFDVPPDDERVRLFAEKHGDESVSLTVYEDGNGERRACADVYFGTLIVWPEEEKEEGIVRALLAEGAEPLRLDFAYLLSRDTFSLLRYGSPGDEAYPYDELDSLSLALAEGHIDRFMRQSYIELLTQRACILEGPQTLFEGEERFYEGYVGEGGLPPLLPAPLLEQVGELMQR